MVIAPQEINAQRRQNEQQRKGYPAIVFDVAQHGIALLIIAAVRIIIRIGVAIAIVAIIIIAVAVRVIAVVAAVIVTIIGVIAVIAAVVRIIAVVAIVAVRVIAVVCVIVIVSIIAPCEASGITVFGRVIIAVLAGIRIIPAVLILRRIIFIIIIIETVFAVLLGIGQFGIPAQTMHIAFAEAERKPLL